MPRRLDLRALRCFTAVAEERSIRKAAERLHMTQPPLSRAIRALEELLGARLLDRNAAGITLTPAGEHLMRRAVPLLAEADAIVEDLRSDTASPAPPLRIGVGMGIPVVKFNRMTAAWRRALPVAPEVVQDFSLKLTQDLRDGRLDFAILALPGDTQGLEVLPLAEQPLVAALPAAHPAARKRRIRLKDVADLKLFWHARATNPSFHDACAAVFRRAGFRPTYETVPPGYVFTLDRIAHGEGFTLVNEWRAATRIKGLAYRELEASDRPMITIAAAWREGARPRGLEAVIETARKIGSWAAKR